MWGRVRRLATAIAAGTVVAVLTGCGAPGTTNQHPTGERSPRAAVSAFLQALEHRDVPGMRDLMTTHAQVNEANSGGLLAKLPELTSFEIKRVERENPRENASPRGSTASLRYTVALTPPDGFNNDDTNGSAYGILVSRTGDRRWLVAEVGGCC